MNSFVQKILTLISISVVILVSIKFSKRKLSITIKEIEQGYIVYENLGLKFKLSELWNKYSEYLIIKDLGDMRDKDNLIYGGKVYGFIFQEIIINLFSIIVFRESNLTPQTELSQITGTYYNKNISNISGYSFYFCIHDFSSVTLEGKADTIYKSMYRDIENILESLSTYKPLIEKSLI